MGVRGGHGRWELELKARQRDFTQSLPILPGGLAGTVHGCQAAPGICLSSDRSSLQGRGHCEQVVPGAKKKRNQAEKQNQAAASLREVAEPGRRRVGRPSGRGTLGAETQQVEEAWSPRRSSTAAGQPGAGLARDPAPGPKLSAAPLRTARALSS